MDTSGHDRQPNPRGGTTMPALLALGTFLATVAVIWGGLRVLSDENGITNLVAGAYRTLGASSSADNVVEYGLTPLTDKILLMTIALLIGVGAVWALFYTVNHLIDRLGPTFERLMRPWVFIMPAVALLAFYLLYPAVRTVIIAFTETGDAGPFANFATVFTNPDMLLALRNNAIWLVVGTTGSVVIGLVFAALVDRVKREALAKTFIFLPIAISMVGAAVIWGFVYEWRPAGETQIGLANWLLTEFGQEPIAFFQTPPINTIVLIIIMVWIQTGFAMVILSAAIKGVPEDILEAARIDGASELQSFFKIVVPSIRGSIVTVATTIFIAVLKVFDIVFVTTGGRFETDVIANRMFMELIRFRNRGVASALAVVLLVAVIPVMIINVRNLRRQGVGA